MRPGQPLAPVHQNQFGASVGGRIIRDRLFFFANFEGFIQHLSNSAILSSPTALQRQGDFSQTTVSNTSSQIVTLLRPADDFDDNEHDGNPSQATSSPPSRISQFSQEFFSLSRCRICPGSRERTICS